MIKYYLAVIINKDTNQELISYVISIELETYRELKDIEYWTKYKTMEDYKKYITEKELKELNYSIDIVEINKDNFDYHKSLPFYHKDYIKTLIIVF